MTNTGRSGQLYREAHDELEEFFGGSAAMWGLHGAPTSEGASTQIWDVRRSSHEHYKRVEAAVKPAPERLRRIARTIEILRDVAPDAWTDALCVLTPRRWPDRLEAEMCRGARGGNLCGLLLRSQRLEGILGTKAMPLKLLTYAADKASRLESDAGAKHAFFQPLRDEGERTYERARARYDVLRVERITAERRSYRGARDRVVAEMRGVFA